MLGGLLGGRLGDAHGDVLHQGSDKHEAKAPGLKKNKYYYSLENNT